QRAGIDPACGRRRRRRPRPRRRSGRCGARAARPGSRERDEVRGRRDAHYLRDLLVGRGRGRGLAWRRRGTPRSTRGGRPLLVPPRACAAARAADSAPNRRGARVKWLRSFGRFWWDFVVGDDWLVAALVAVAIGATAALAAADIPAWWLLPLAVPPILW